MNRLNDFFAARSVVLRTDACWDYITINTQTLLKAGRIDFQTVRGWKPPDRLLGLQPIGHVLDSQVEDHRGASTFKGQSLFVTMPGPVPAYMRVAV